MQAVGSWYDTQVFLDGELMTITGEDGWIVILDAPVGTHRLRAYRPGYLSSEKTVEVVPGSVTDAGETLLIAGDAFQDDQIDMLDVMTVQAAIGRCVNHPSYQRWIDANGDGCVDTHDLAVISENFGRQGPMAWLPIP